MIQPIGGTSGIGPIIRQAQAQAKASLLETQAKMQDAQERSGAVVRAVLSASVTSSTGSSLDLKV
ncbi:MAG: hypothetical protein JXR94_10475 [Candidatus Hydrogenedentes bacterium]|nr:hypothetical protein [Candidatus Hydrogenedentota bacterium]